MPTTRDAHYYDHLRDERKVDRTGRDFNPLPLHAQSAPIAGALEVAILAQAVPLVQAADLIEQYARTCAAAARLDAVAVTIDRCIDAIDAHGKSDVAEQIIRRAT